MTPLKTAFVYSEKFSEFSYGNGHPMMPVRLKLTYETIKECGLLELPNTELIKARMAKESEILLFHTKDYLEALKKADSGGIDKDSAAHGIGSGDNPAFKGVFTWSCYSAGASIQAAELVANGRVKIAFNIAGGLHHAMKDRASGFCYLNDAAIAIKYLISIGKRVGYVDIDAHHGDGVEAAFYDSDKVLTISLHESGEYLFPGTGFSKDMGVGIGRGYAVNLPLPPNAGDELFTLGFKEIVPLFINAFSPDILLTQLGADSFKTDPITHLNLTTNGFEEMIKSFKSFNLPWVALGGGGYNIDSVKRAWTLAWAIMNGVDNEKIAALRDSPRRDIIREEDKKAVEKTIAFLKKEALPLIKGKNK